LHQALKNVSTGASDRPDNAVHQAARAMGVLCKAQQVLVVLAYGKISMIAVA